MDSRRRFALTTAGFGLVALVHALFTWSFRATIALFVGGALVAFVAEILVVHAGWLVHHVEPKLYGVPLYVPLGWTGTIYAALRVALLLTQGWSAVPLAAFLATAYDRFADHHGVARGLWTYTDDLPGPRDRTVPWWNYLGWFLVSSITAALAVPFL